MLLYDYIIFSYFFDIAVENLHKWLLVGWAPLYYYYIIINVVKRFVCSSTVNSVCCSIHLQLHKTARGEGGGARYGPRVRQILNDFAPGARKPVAPYEELISISTRCLTVYVYMYRYLVYVYLCMYVYVCIGGSI